ncbi:MAG: caspase family protein, partial [Pikeienuella sp.]
MKRSALIWFLGGICLANPVLADGGAALVIGNADYAHGPKAVAALADAKAVRKRLDDAGFSVTYGENLSRADMRAAFEAFGGDAIDADQLVVFYSGHALRMNGDTYLAPVDIDATGPVAVAYDASPLSVVMSILSTKPDAAVAFIDGAQLDGFTPTNMVEPGLGDIAVPKGVLVVSAAAPGWAIRRAGEGRSKFGRAIVDSFLRIDQPVSVALNAHEGEFWSDGDADTRMVITPKQDEPAPVALPTTPVSTADSTGDDIAQQIELAFWKSTETAGTPDDYQAYLDRYPNGLFASIARNRLADAGRTSPKVVQDTQTSTAVTTPAPQTTATTAADIESALRLTRSERRAVQADLLVLGHDPNGVDGVFGRGARSAISRWQRQENFPSNGFLTSEQIAILAADANAVRAEQDREVERQAALDEDNANTQEEVDWGRAQQIHTVTGYRRYIRTYPNGRFVRDSKRAIADLEYSDEDAFWDEVERRDTASAYDEYLEAYPNGRYARTARTRLNNRFSSVADNTVKPYEADWQEARARNDYESYRHYLRTYPNSPYAKEAEKRYDALYEQHLVRKEDALQLGRKDWLSIEQRLASIGYSVGKINGKPGR